MSTPHSEQVPDDAPGDTIAPAPWPAGSPTPSEGSDLIDSALAHVGLLADRVGTSVLGLVAGAVGVVVVVGLAWMAFFAAGPAAPELTIPYASRSTTTLETVPAETSDGDAGELMVHAAGAVRHPGVYVLAGGSRVSDALTAAGGPLPDADLDRVNLAAPIADGSRLYVPRVGEDSVPDVVAGDRGGGSGGATPEPAAGDPGAMIDINTATAAELESLPGIGPATASAIVEHRERHGPFAQVDDLVNVRGIGDAKLAALRDRVHV